MGERNKVASSQVGLLLISERKFRRPPAIKYCFTIKAVSEDEAEACQVRSRNATPYDTGPFTYCRGVKLRRQWNGITKRYPLFDAPGGPPAKGAKCRPLPGSLATGCNKANVRFV